jgi:hypothetical protein
MNTKTAPQPGRSNRTPYWQLLQDPRWQKKRLEVLDRDGFCYLISEALRAGLIDQETIKQWQAELRLRRLLSAPTRTEEQP